MSELRRIPVRRVLQPGGSFLFVEHGLAAEARVARWQDRLTPCGAGCSAAVISTARSTGCWNGPAWVWWIGHLIRGPRFATFHYRGRARA
jgi:hypothetical protein